MSKVISFLNQKGGVGKTTLAVNVASQLFKNGFQVLLVDLDLQGSATTWSAQQDEEKETFPVVQMNKNLARDLPKISRGYDYVIVDGSPQVSELAALAIKVSDAVLIPCQPSPFDIWACADLIEIIRSRQIVTDGLPLSAFVISMAIKGTKLENEIKPALEEYEMPVFDSGTSRSVNYIEASKSGSSVIELPASNPSRKEIEAIVEELEAFLGV